MFPFGFGLSFTEYEFSNLSVSAVSTVGNAQVSFDVENKGQMSGKAVCQVFVSCPSGSGRLVAPVKELAGFTKVGLDVGERRRVSVDLAKEAFSYWDERRNEWVALKGEYKVSVGGDSTRLDLVGQAVLEQEFSWRGL